MEIRMVAFRLREFNYRMAWRRIKEGIPEPSWTDDREKEVGILIGQHSTYDVHRCPME